jgi:hypothetical protein
MDPCSTHTSSSRGRERGWPSCWTSLNEDAGGRMAPCGSKVAGEVMEEVEAMWESAAAGWRRFLRQQGG